MPHRGERHQGAESRVTIACVQTAPAIGERERNIEASVRLLHEAADRGATLIVLPELVTSGYVFNSREEAWRLSEPVPGGPATARWAEVAALRSCHIVAGVCERDGVRLYNTAVLVGPEGHIGTYRKMHLWDGEKLFFEPGDRGFPVFPTRIGRIGMLICHDTWFPEAHRILAVQGADVACIPTNWSRSPRQRPGEKPMAVYHCMTAAQANAMYVAAANRVGAERGQSFIGHSVICTPIGRPAAGPAGEGEEVLCAEVNLVESRRAKKWGDLNVIMQDRRTDFYDVALGSGVKPFPF